jgi:hypothetical protein
MVKYIQKEAEEQNWIKIEDNCTFLYLDEIVYMNRIGRDADNLKKLLQDSITQSGVVWTDDTYCLPRTQRILIDKNHPRVELEISLAPYVGIFENIDEMLQFRYKCVKCVNFKQDKCKILNNAIEGRVQEEIQDGECLKFRGKKIRERN